MKALTYQGSKDVRVEEVQDPSLQEAVLENIGLGKLRPEAVITNRMPLTEARRGYEIFNEKQEDCRKIVLHPGSAST